MRVLLLSRYGELGASSRLRSYQYLAYLSSQGLAITVAPLLSDEYVTSMYKGKLHLASVVAGYFKRFRQVVRARDFDVVWLEKEMLPWLPSWMELGLLPRDIPLVVDYDDATFHRYDLHRAFPVRTVLGKKIDKVMRRADLVIVGNDYLAERARQAGARRVEHLPTVVDPSRYDLEPGEALPKLTIGWIGSPATAHYLRPLEPVLRELMDNRDVRVVAIGANPEQLQDLPIEVRPWSERTEAKEIQEFDIGVMPLPDEQWERGKCGYKLLQYMASRKPVVASPVGANAIIVRDGVEGFLADSRSDWSEALSRLSDSPSLRREMGLAGRERVEAKYSLSVTAPRLEELLRSAVETPLHRMTQARLDNKPRTLG